MAREGVPSTIFVRRNGRRLAAWAFAVGLSALILIVGLRTGVIERRFIYFPEARLDADPSSVGLTFDEASFVANDGVRLHGWFVPGPRDVTMLWLHGNAGNISHRLDNLALVHDRLGVSVFLFDYRGYGRSEGTPSEAGTYRDAEAALGYLRDRGDIAMDRVVYFGRSLGAAVAVETALRRPPLGLILESPFPSVPDMARRVYPFVPSVAWRALRTRYDAEAKIASVRAPLLVIHGDSDEIVPPEEGRRVYDAAPEPKGLHVIPGAGHNDTYVLGGESYFDALRRFIEGL